MKHLTLPIGLALTLSALSSQAAYDGKVDITDAPGLGTGSGGAFTIKVVSGLTGVGKAVGDTFLSFCLESNEYITVPGTGYDANVNSKAVNGGSGGPKPDPISKATAWLYSNFINGTLSAATSGTFQMNDQGGNDLQDAIWWLEEEQTGNYNYLVTAAETALGLNAGNVQGTDAGGAFGVRVLNLFGGPPTDRGPLNQDMLVVPEPTTYIAGGLLGLPFLVSMWRKARAARQVAA